MGNDRSIDESLRARLPLRVMLVFTLALVVLGGLRFARIDLAGTSFFATDNYYTWNTEDGRHIEHLNIDISQYLAMVEDYRGVDGAFEKQEPYPEFAADYDTYKGPVEPFTQRVALPWLASLIPLDSSYAFALVNLVLVVMGLWFLVDALAVSGRSPTAQAIGAALYTFALPVVVYASSLFIDGGVVGVLVIGYWLVVRRYWAAVVVFFPVSFMVKEALLILAPTAVWAWKTSGHSLKDPRFLSGAAISAAGVVATAWWVSATAPEAVFSFTVLPTWGFLRFNLTSPVSAVFFALSVSTVVIPALLGTAHLWRTMGPRGSMLGSSGPDLVGFAMVILLNIYSIASTDLTARTGWLIWPFAISLAAVWVDQQSDLPARFDRRLSGPVRS
ncbi:MAG: hypothetical protein H6517_01765 [Microthrixaceae bacterium]|nr:hypothetical protein [Microthrixaceae bacterium]MCB1010028.1 hypothetical protein [Microthrixaceae bacterium]MCB9386538.1 hypothetical protein [Microthrixaceae bacterium]MCO5320093.1 hypothetical protein [Microthrixaceae bacterium]